MLIAALWACGSGKGAVTDAQREETRDLVENHDFEFTGQWAMPFSGQDMNQLWRAGLLQPGDSPNRINLTGNYNFLKIRKDTVSAYLPFYGEQHMGVSLNPQDQAIQFDEQAKDLLVEYDKGKDKYEIRFTASYGTQGYVLFLTIFPNASATLRVNCSSRDNIVYQGNIHPVREKEE